MTCGPPFGPPFPPITLQSQVKSLSLVSWTPRMSSLERRTHRYTRMMRGNTGRCCVPKCSICAIGTSFGRSGAHGGVREAGGRWPPGPRNPMCGVWYGQPSCTSGRRSLSGTGRVLSHCSVCHLCKISYLSSSRALQTLTSFFGSLAMSMVGHSATKISMRGMASLCMP